MKVNVNFSLSPPVFRIKNRMTTGQVSLNKQHTTFYIRTFLDTSDKHSCLEYNMQPIPLRPTGTLSPSFTYFLRYCTLNADPTPS